MTSVISKPKESKMSPGASSDLPITKTKRYTQKIFKIYVVDLDELKCQNALLLQKKDIERLFPTAKNNPDKLRYVQIADHIFRIAQGRFKVGWIGVMDHQRGDISDAIFKNKGVESVIVTKVYPDRIDPVLFERVEFVIQNIVKSEDFGSDVLLLDELSRQVRSFLKNEYISSGRGYFFHFPFGFVEVYVGKCWGVETHIGGYKPFGFINDKTELKFRASHVSTAKIADQVYRDEVKKFIFSLNLVERVKQRRSDTLPVTLDYEEIAKEIKKRVVNKLITIDHQITIPHSSGWDITVRFENSNLKEDSIPKKQISFEERDYITAYSLSDDSKISLKFVSGDIIITKGELKTADTLFFHITKIPEDQSGIKIDHSKELWVSVAEIRQALAKLIGRCVIGQNIELDLSSGKFLFKFIKARPKGLEEMHSVTDTRVEASDSKEGFSGVLSELKTKSSHSQSGSTSSIERNLLNGELENIWLLDESTKIKISSEKMLNINIVKDSLPRLVKKICVEVEGVFTNNKTLAITIDSLKKIFKEQTSDKFICKQKFNVETTDGERLTLRITDIEFKDVKETKNKTFFGEIDEDTRIEFFSKGPITVVEEVLRNEVDKFQFTVSAKKRHNSGKWARTPLIVNVEDLISEIKREFQKKNYILKGGSFLVKYGDGWDISVQLNQVVLSKDYQTDYKVSFAGSKHISGYTLSDKAEFEIDTGNLEIALIQGAPLLAETLNFKVVDILDNYTSEGQSVLKGNWVNLSEFKEAILEISKAFTPRMRFMMELKSGKYLIEITSGNPKEPGKIPADKRYYTPWEIDKETKTNISIEQIYDIQLVIDDQKFPLKKIELIVDLNHTRSDYTVVTNEELREAFLAGVPKRITKNQVYSFATKSSVSVLMEIKELVFVDKKIQKEKIGSFGFIDSDTEIIFKSQEESDLIIRKRPKILDVDDPIKYLENLGIGGIDEQFNEVFRTFLFYSDTFKEELEKRDLKPLRGIIFCGPPGTGKTSLAKHVGEMLGCEGKRLKMITSTEIFNMWFGESESKIRELFEPAGEAYAKFKDDSDLYILVIEEIDALLPKRGASFNKVRDSLVNQFLSIMDGLNQIHNILVIGTTNRIEDIDPAALRHGRFGVHVKIDKPNEAGRKKIFEIHTKKLRDEGILDKDADFGKLAKMTPDMAGADIEGFVKEANLVSLLRLQKLRCTKEEIATRPERIVTMKDFEKVIDERKKRDNVTDVPEGMYL